MPAQPPSDHRPRREAILDQREADLLALEQRVDRGLSADRGLLVVIDGAKALAAAVRKVFGQAALIQRCTLHKRRNCADHLPQSERGWVDARLAKAFNHADPAAGLRMARDLARQLETRWPDAAASLREGLEEMFTVRRLGSGDRLARTLTSTNPIESMISVGRSTTHNVKRWRDGTMVKRWAAAGMLNAERGFRAVTELQQRSGHPRVRRHPASSALALENDRTASGPAPRVRPDGPRPTATTKP